MSFRMKMLIAILGMLLVCGYAAFNVISGA
jgi:hypothetical protein